MPSHSIAIHLIGDSTMADKAASERPETGWGTPFSEYFDSSVSVENHARNGRSTRTFLEDGRWQPVVQSLTSGDYVLIQFGHNDEVPSKEQYTTEAEFTANLEKFVEETHEQGAKAVLLTPIARRHFDEVNTLKDTHREYSGLVRDVARTQCVPLVDADERSRSLLCELGSEGSKTLYNHLAPDEHPNYPQGVADDTHFSEYGARRMAEIVLDGIEELDLELAAHIEYDDP